MKLERLISGAQTGADRGGLDAAIALGIPHGGVVPFGRRAEDGRVPDRYEVEEIVSTDYRVRTQQNVDRADGTIVFTRGTLGPGSRLTLDLLSNRPHVHVDLDVDPDPVRSVQDWLRAAKPNVINIAGSRESKAPGIQEQVRQVLLGALRPCRPLVVDSETHRIAPMQLAPRLVCAGIGDDAGCQIVLRDEALARIREIALGERLLVGQYIAFDLAVACSEDETLLPLAYDMYANDRVSDIGIREKLIHLAWGVLRGFMQVNGKVEKLSYGLKPMASRHLGIELEKDDDDESTRMNFAALDGVSVERWPSTAVEYVMTDVFATLGVWKAQEEHVDLLDDEYRQSRAEWWLRLMSCWGLHVDRQGVREFAARTQRSYDEIEAEMIRLGIVRADKKRSRNIKAVRERVRQAYIQTGRKVPSTAKGNIKTDADVCDLSRDPVLERYAELSSLKTKLSTDIPLLSPPSGVLQAKFETLLETGRTSSSPNVQNLRTEVGTRECFSPRPGWVYAIVDYPQIELRTWAQVCLDVLGFSDMANALREGLDPHCMIAALILGIPYDQAVAEYKDDPKGRVYFPRQSGKVCNFGCPGGLGEARLRDYARKNYGVVLYETEEEAKANGGVTSGKLRGFWYDSWSEARPYFDWVKSQTEVDSPRIRQLYSGRYRGGVGFCDAANGFFQGLAACAAKNAGFLISRACYAEPKSPLYGSRLVNFVHDEFVTEVPDDDRAHDAATELARLAKEGAKPFIPDIPLEVEAVLARRWSKKCKPVRGPDGRLVPWEMAA